MITQAAGDRIGQVLVFQVPERGSVNAEEIYRRGFTWGSTDQPQQPGSMPTCQ